MAIETVLEAMWPGAAEDLGVGKQYGIKFVPRTIAVWRQFAVVEKLMSERDPAALKKDIIAGEDGFDRFGKECREFIFRFQSMSMLDYSKSYYLHTLLHHAGDFMRALQAEGFTLGMMSNSGAERRHEYGRRASRKALASNGWRKKNSVYDQKTNLIIYLTLHEVLKWDYGEDLISYIIAKRVQDGIYVIPAGCKPDFSKIKSRRASRAEDEEALLSQEEALREFDAQPDDEPPDFETSNTNFWARSGKKNAYALVGVESDPEEGSGAGGKMFDPDDELKLFDWVSLPFSHDDESEAGSEVDVYDLTINDFIIEEEDEDTDESYAPVEADEGSERYEWDVENEDYSYPAKSTPDLRLRPQSVTMLAAEATAAAAKAAPVIHVEPVISEAQADVSRTGLSVAIPQALLAQAVSIVSAPMGGPGPGIPAEPVDDDDGSRRRPPARAREGVQKRGRGRG